MGNGFIIVTTLCGWFCWREQKGKEPRVPPTERALATHAEVVMLLWAPQGGLERRISQTALKWLEALRHYLLYIVVDCSGASMSTLERVNHLFFFFFSVLFFIFKLFYINYTKGKYKMIISTYFSRKWSYWPHWILHYSIVIVTFCAIDVASWLLSNDHVLNVKIN